MINLNLLYSFFICAEHLNISKAAAVLGISQPSLSMQIKNLEEQIGTSLFLRNGKSISLTAKGRELVKTSGVFYDLRDEVTKLSDQEDDASKSEILRILVTNEVERPFVAEVVSKLIKRDRKKLAILASTTEEALSKTVNNETDILLSHEKVDSSWSHVRVDFPVFLATSGRKKLPTFDDPSNIEKILEYLGEDLIVPGIDTKLGQEFNIFRRKHKLKMDVILESNIVSCLVRFVASSAGCAFLPLPYIKSSFYQNHIQLIGPHQGYWNHSIYIYANISKKELEVHPLVKSIRTYGSV
jgi:LysR family transcriptional activator of nhaA